MHEPNPFGQFSADDLSEDDAAFIKNLTQRLTNLKDVSELPSMKMVRSLPSGGQVIAFDMGGVRKVIVRKPQKEEKPDEQHDGRVKLAVPMLFSGVVDEPVVRYGSGVKLTLTQTASRRLKGYEGNGPDSVTLQRFAIEYGPKHQEFVPENPTRLYTQYDQLYSSWFSGRAASLVQVAGGYGRHDFNKLPEDPIERATMVLPGNVQRAVAKELKFSLDESDLRKPPMLPGYKGWPPSSGQVQFDYEFLDSYGVTFGADNTPWLVRVQPIGVHAMPLPMVPATTTQAFRDYVAEKGDAEIQWLLDTFGGMPSGEGFPAPGEDFEAWKRAGVVIKVCDTADFYSHGSGYSSAMGWSFNTTGTQAVNTCYEFGDGDGIQRGKTYMMGLSMGPLKDHGMVHGFQSAGDPVLDDQLGAYLVLVHQGLKNSERDLALKYKLRKASTADLLARASNRLANAKDEQEYWDKLEAPPIAPCSGDIRLYAQGMVWAPGQPRSHPQIKFPEPWARPYGCLSHDFGRLEGYPAPDPEPRCDTIMHAYFIGDDLKVVKYFRDIRTSEDVEEENDFDECMQIGSWTQTITHTPKGLMGLFYTSDFDAREVGAVHTTVNTIRGSDLGYDTTPNFSFDDFFSQVGTLWRNRYFQHDTHSVEQDGYGLVITMCVPYLAPNSIIQAFQKGATSVKTTDSRQVYGVRDPNSYRYFTYHFVWAWVGGDASGNAGTHTGPVYPDPRSNGGWLGQPVWVIGYNYSPGACTDFADQGNWLGGLPQDITWLVHPDTNSWNHSGGGGRPTVKNFTRSKVETPDPTGNLQISLDVNPQPISKEVPRIGYFEMSPSEYGDVFYVDAARNEAGDAVYSSCSEEEAPGSKTRKHWGYSKLADHKTPPRFIGVVNE